MAEENNIRNITIRNNLIYALSDAANLFTTTSLLIELNEDKLCDRQKYIVINEPTRFNSVEEYIKSKDYNKRIIPYLYELPIQEQEMLKQINHIYYELKTYLKNMINRQITQKDTEFVTEISRQYKEIIKKDLEEINLLYNS